MITSPFVGVVLTNDTLPKKLERQDYSVACSVLSLNLTPSCYSSLSLKLTGNGQSLFGAQQHTFTVSLPSTNATFFLITDSSSLVLLSLHLPITTQSSQIHKILDSAALLSQNSHEPPSPPPVSGLHWVGDSSSCCCSGQMPFNQEISLYKV